MHPMLELIRIHRPIPILLLLWPVYTALFMAAGGWPGFKLFSIFTLGAILMRSAGCIINDICDRPFDGQVTRTQARPLVSGQLTLLHAIIGFFVLALMALFLAIQLSFLTFQIALIAFVMACVYPLSKRWCPYPQAILGATYNIGVLMAYAEIQHRLPAPVWVLYIGTIFWTLAYDTFYAQADAEQDISLGLHSSVLSMGPYVTQGIIVCQSLAWLCFCALGLWIETSIVFWIGLCLIPLSFLQQHRIAQKGGIAAYIQAFSLNNITGLLLFLTVISHL